MLRCSKTEVLSVVRFESLDFELFRRGDRGDSAHDDIMI